jgi:HK97 family phage portal protein
VRGGGERREWAVNGAKGRGGASARRAATPYRGGVFRRIRAATAAFVASSNTPAVPVEAPATGGTLDVTAPVSNWQRLWGDGDGATSSADRLAAVYGCVSVIASSIAAMPLQLYKSDGARRERERKHRLAGFLGDAPNEAMTWTQLREAILYTMILRGNAHARCFWSSGFVREMFPLPYGSVTSKITDLRRVVYEIGSNPWKVPAGSVSRPDLAHFKALSADGIDGINPIKHCRLSTSAASALALYGKNSAEEGQPIRGFITSQNTFKNDNQAKDIRRRWSEAWQGAKNGDGVAIFEGGDMKFHQVTMSMRDAQFIESMSFSVEEICRIFNVPPHKVQKLDRATFNNIEHLSREFYIATLVPWITRIEATLNQCLLTKGDREAGYYLRHNADGLLRGDLASRSEAMSKQISSALMTPNEGRALEDRPPLPGGDVLIFSSNHVPLEKLGAESAEPGAQPPKKEEKP